MPGLRISAWPAIERAARVADGFLSSGGIGLDIYAAALGKSLIVMHGPDHQHALKEVDAAALAVVETPAQIVSILDYVINGKLAGYTD